MRKKSRIGIRERIARATAKARLAWREWRRFAFAESIFEDMLKHTKKTSETAKLSDVKTAIKKIREVLKTIGTVKKLFEKLGRNTEKIEQNRQKIKEQLKRWIRLQKAIMQRESMKRAEKFREN